MEWFRGSDSVENIGLSGNDEKWTPDKVSAVSNWTLFIIIASLLFGMLAVTAKFYYIAALIVGVLLLWLISWQFEAALAIYSLVAFIPWGRTPDLATGGSGTGKGIFVCEAMLGFLLVIWIVRYLMNQLPQKRISSGFYVPLGLYIVYCVINVVHSYLFWDPHVSRIYQHLSVNIIELGIRILSASAMIIAATSVSNAKMLRVITFSLMVAGFYNLTNALIGNKIPLMTPWWPLVTLLPVCYSWLVVMNGRAQTYKRAICAVIVALSVYIIAFKSVEWVSGWLGLIAAIATVTFIKNKRVFVYGLLLCCAVMIVGSGFIHKNVVDASVEGGDYDRFSLLAGAVKYATHFPLGVGLGNYRTYNSFYYGQKWGTTSYTSAHGTYAQALSETGWPGLLLLVSIIIGGFIWLIRCYRQIDNEFTKTFLLAVIGQTAGISVAACIGDYILPTYHNGGLMTFSATVYSWLAWGLAIAHVRLAGGEKNGPVDSGS